MARIVLLGCGGSGKTRLARLLAQRIGVPGIVLDEIWRPDWTAADTPAFRATLRGLHAADAWVSDGNFAAVSFDIRLPRATQIVWVEAPRWLCLLRATLRVFRRDSDHRIGGLWKAYAFVWNFDRINRPRIEGLRMQFGPDVPVARLRGRKGAADFIDTATPDHHGRVKPRPW
jgi:adenylate kinase family enzyme